MEIEPGAASEPSFLPPSRLREGLGEGSATSTIPLGDSPPPTPPASGRGEFSDAIPNITIP